MSVSAPPTATRSVLPPAEEYLEVGYNYRMTDLQAAVGIVQLGRLDEMVARRRELAAATRQLSERPGHPLRRGPRPRARATSSRSGSRSARSYPLDRDELLAHLAAQDISARRGIMAAHRQPAYADHRARARSTSPSG